MVIEIRGVRAATKALLGIAVIIAVGSGMVLARGPLVAAGVVFGVAALIAALCVWTIVRQPPQVRATEQGVSFGGRAPIPWSEIKQVYVGTFNVSAYGMAGKTRSISFDFHRKLTLLRLPVTYWFGTMLAVGDVDVAPPTTGERADVLASRLEAMRVQAVGAIDGVTVGGADLPAARLVERDPR